MSAKDDTVNLNTLPASKRKRVKRFLSGDKHALRTRDKLLGLRFATEDIERWTDKAEKKGVSLTVWIETHLNAIE